jgi:hypothetical protein
LPIRIFRRDLEDLRGAAVRRNARRQQEIRDAVERVVVDEDRAEQRLLGLDIVRRLTIKRALRYGQFSGCIRHFSINPQASSPVAEPSEQE